MDQNNQLAVIESAKDSFVSCMESARGLDIVNNCAAAFDAAVVINRLKAVLTDEVMTAVFLPLQGQKIGFRTDKSYPLDIVRTCIIDAAANGLMPTGNQFNIIAGNMYPTKEGYTALLSRLKQSEMKLQYSFEFDAESNIKSADPQYMAIPCKVSYKTSSESTKGFFRYTALVKVNRNQAGDVTSNIDQLRGKAERKCKKAFFEFLTGLDLGDGDADNIETPCTVVSSTPAKSASQIARDAVSKMRSRQAKQEPEQMSEADIEAELDAVAHQQSIFNEGE